jgi:hypothetical protein
MTPSVSARFSAEALEHVKPPKIAGHIERRQLDTLERPYGWMADMRE